MVVLCEAGQTRVDVGSKEWKVDLKLEIFNIYPMDLLFVCKKTNIPSWSNYSLLKSNTNAYYHLFSERHKSLDGVIKVMVADPHGGVVEHVAKLPHRAVLQLCVPGGALGFRDILYE